MTYREVVPFCPHRLYSLRCLAMNHRRYIAYSVRRTGCSGGNLPPLAVRPVVGHLDLLQSNQKRLSFRPERSGVEESTTLDNEPTQDKTCYLGRFLDSHSLPRNDMSGGGSVLSARVIFVTLHGDESSPLHCVVPFNRTGCIRNVAGGRLPNLR